MALREGYARDGGEVFFGASDGVVVNSVGVGSGEVFGFAKITKFEGTISVRKIL